MNKNTSTNKKKINNQFLYLLLVIELFITFYFLFLKISKWTNPEFTQNLTYINLFLLHMVIGLILIIPFVIFIKEHVQKYRKQKKIKKRMLGYLLIVSITTILSTGVYLFYTPVVNQLQITSYLHVYLPLLSLIVLFFHLDKFHLSENKLLIFSILLIIFINYLYNYINVNTHINSNAFLPALTQTSNNQTIPSQYLDNNKYCQSCHQDIHEGWLNSMHKASSFNNPAYAFSVNTTRDFLIKRDGNHKASRICAACHDPVILLSGAFDKDIDFSQTTIGRAGITCTVCHSVSQINSVKGNGSYTISQVGNYPFTFSKLPFLTWINNKLINIKPDYHKHTYLKPLHKTAEFCSVCHKVSLPKELNNYHWLRGQNHYDSYELSAVSGHSVNAYYYPDKIKKNCSSCHMQTIDSDDVGTFYNKNTQSKQIHSHYFDASNTAIKLINKLKYDPDNSLLKRAVSIDLFGLRKNGQLTGQLIAPLENGLSINSDETYLLETVISSANIGHEFTQGTTDSNQVWVAIDIYNNDQLIYNNGGMNENGRVDEDAYFINAWVIGKQGNKINNRNVEQVQTMVYNHVIPAGSSSVVHYQLDIPPELVGNLRIEARVYYRKFNNDYYQNFKQNNLNFNDLPISLLAHKSVRLNIDSHDNTKAQALSNWKRWNNYAIALLNVQAYKQADAAIKQVIKHEPAKGWINLTRSYIKQGRLSEAQIALNNAINDKNFEYFWQLDYFSGLIAFKQGKFDKANQFFEKIYRSKYDFIDNNVYDFSKDYQFVNLYAQSYFQLSQSTKGNKQPINQKRAIQLFNKVLTANPEYFQAHFSLYKLYLSIGNTNKVELHKKHFLKYKIDENKDDKSISLALNNNENLKRAFQKHAIYPLNSHKLYPRVSDFINSNGIQTND